MFVYCRSAICTHAFVLWENVTECDWQVPGTGEMGGGGGACSVYISPRLVSCAQGTQDTATLPSLQV